tara:strand:+ start:310 stop:1044 length:735 start_codon:yes stop_codon:yes gene_type:complete
MKKNYKFLLPIFLLFLFCKKSIVSQEILLFEKTPAKFEDFDGDFGPNRKKFNFSSLGFGTPIPLSIDSEKFIPTNIGFFMMINKNFKHKINNFLALHCNVGYSSSRFYLDENFNSEMPNQSLNPEKVRYLIRNLKSNAGIQINFKTKRGNQFGKYINLGGYAGWVIHHKLKYSYSNSKTYVDESKLNYFESLNYGLTTKLGIKKNSIFINYRLSNFFNSEETNLLELPRFIVGFEIDIFSGDYR